MTKGQAVSDDTRAKMSAAQKKRHRAKKRTAKAPAKMRKIATRAARIINAPLIPQRGDLVALLKTAAVMILTLPPSEW